MDIGSIESILNEKIILGSSVGGGCMANTTKIKTQSGKMFFLKSGLSGNIFFCEANGLKELSQTNTIRIPEVIAVDENFLLLEYIERGNLSDNFFEKFGQMYALMHRCQTSIFGFYEDNYIGATPQLNVPSDEESNNWTAFYFNKRLLYQYRLAEQNGYVTSRLKNGFMKLESKISAILSGSEEPPCLLHGDLWSGNYMCDENGNPVLIDPAVYYGHREADLAMTKLFGGFSPAFYRVYLEAYPLPDGWEYRENIYKLYHVMNHLNLFGPGYLSEAEQLLTNCL